VILRGGEVLLVKRGREPFKGFWSLPGGVVETGELLKDAVCREMREETGLEVEPLEVVEVFESISPEFHFVVIDYVCRVTGGTLQAADDVTEARWFPCRELPDHLTAGAAGVIEKALACSRAAG
jgi:ADP-ribose pyrophosphatase YjhB (NUDIX family)